LNFQLTADRITKKQLLAHRTEEEYMSFYLGINPDHGLHRNPLRKDRKPSASFYRDNNGDGQLRFKDWATGERLNFVDVVMVKYQCNLDKALKIIGNDFGIISKPHYEKHERAVEFKGDILDSNASSILQGEVVPFKDKDILWWKSFGITEETLKKYDVHNLKTVFLNGYPSFFSNNRDPIYGYYFGKEDGRELWKMYMPNRQTFRFLLNTNKLQGLKQLPKTGDVLVVTKSLKDVMVLYEMGIPAIATQGESMLLSDVQYKNLSERFKRIVFNGDADPAGIKFMANSRRKYSGIAMTFMDQERFAKDVSDYVKKVGFSRAQRVISFFINKIQSGEFDRQLGIAAKFV
jgi:hypothetical protein